MNRRNHGCRVTADVVIKGNRAVIMENQLLRITILADRGADIIELLYKPEDIDFMWRSPAGLHRKADYIASDGDSLGNYLDHNSGGWQEILPNGGRQCCYKGACLGFHGEISNVPWNYQVVKDEAEEIVLRFSINTLRSPFRLVKELALKANDSTVYINEELTNLAEEPMELMWGHHPTVGEPFLDESCRIRTRACFKIHSCHLHAPLSGIFAPNSGCVAHYAPFIRDKSPTKCDAHMSESNFKTRSNALRGFTLEPEDFSSQRLKPGLKFSWPVARTDKGVTDMSVIPGAGAGTAEMVYLTGFPVHAEYEVYNQNRRLSYGMRWNGADFPYLWLWLVCKGAMGYPWYGRTYNLALEPWTSYSANGLTGAVENKSALKLMAGETRKIKFSFWAAKKEEMEAVQ